MTVRESTRRSGTSSAILLALLVAAILGGAGGCRGPGAADDRPTPREAERETRAIVDELVRRGDAGEAAGGDLERLERLRPFVRDPNLGRRADLWVLAARNARTDPLLRRKIREAREEILRAHRNRRLELRGTPISAAELFARLEGDGAEEERREAWEALVPFWREIAPLCQRLFELRDAAARSAGWETESARKDDLEEMPDGFVDAAVAAIFEATEDSYRSGFREDRAMPWSLRSDDPGEAHRFAEPVPLESALEAAAELLAGMGFDAARVEEVLGEERENGSDLATGGDLRRLFARLGRSLYVREAAAAGAPEFRRTASNALAEGVGLLFADLGSDPKWLRSRFRGLHSSEGAAISETAWERAARLRFLTVRVEFENEVARNPSRDLDELFWNLLEKRLGTPRFEEAPFWAADPAPVRVSFVRRDELVARIVASQLRNYLVRAFGRIAGNPAAGEFLRRRIFVVGAAHPWHRILEEATAEPPNPLYFARDVLEGPPAGLPAGDEAPGERSDRSRKDRRERSKQASGSPF